MKNDFSKAGLLAVVLTAAFFFIWEICLRNKGLNISYDDGFELWSHHRGQVYRTAGTATVFIGSSRIKYALDIPTWEKGTGNKAVQLAIEGNSPLPVLDDLAEDVHFKGNLVVDVTEGLFFSNDPNSIDYPKQHVKYYRDRTPAQAVSFSISHFLESLMVFLDRDNFSLNVLLRQLPVQKRKGVFALANEWPLEFGRISFERQNIMMEKFLRDTVLQKKVTDNWLFFDQINEEKPAEGKKMDSILTAIRAAVQKIEGRGGDVLFVRTPSSGYYWPTEQISFPREKYWDRLLSFTGAPGIHFVDYKETDHFICPEWSHLSPADAIIYTRELNKQVEQKGWTFSNKHNTDRNQTSPD